MPSTETLFESASFTAWGMANRRGCVSCCLAAHTIRVSVAVDALASHSLFHRCHIRSLGAAAVPTALPATVSSKRFMQLNAEALAGLSKRQRAALVNSLPGYKPAVLVGTQTSAGQTNLAIISSLFHVGASPPLLGMIIRPSPEGTDRHTLNNILSTGAYTLNSFTYADRKSAHHTSARFDGEQSEFDACGFTALHNDKLGAPFVKEAPLKVGCCLRELPINRPKFNTPDHR